jgi:hypothetical protein
MLLGHPKTYHEEKPDKKLILQSGCHYGTGTQIAQIRQIYPGFIGLENIIKKNAARV